MIGRVRFQSQVDGRHIDCILGDDLLWQVPALPPLAPHLNALANAREASPADGAAGIAALHKVAKMFDGTVEIEPKTPAPEGTVY